MLEMAGQTTAILEQLTEENDAFLGFGGVSGCKFREAVQPPARLYVLCKRTERRPRRITAETQGVVNGRMVFQATIIGTSLG